ncbi:MAG: calcium-binding protein [Planctomycetota bacterium]
MQLMETLELRKLLTANLSDAGVLRVIGDEGVDNTIAVTIETDAPGGPTVEPLAVVTINGIEELRVAADDVRRVYVHGRDGNDTIDVAAVGNLTRVFGWAGDDTITTESRSIQRGGAGNDVLNGSDARDFLGGSVGDDTLNGNGGNDYMKGSDGNDEMNGGDGRDLMLGGGGDDVMSGGTGNDLLIGSLGDDLLNGNDGDDKLFGGPGTDTLFGSAGADDLFGGFENEDDEEDTLDAGGDDGDSEDLDGVTDPPPSTGRGLRGLWGGRPR